MATAATISQPLTGNQIRGFLAAWGGWALDGMDSFIYALVLVPALTELLPASGIEASDVNIGTYGTILFALFLLGWGMSMMWGPIGDRIGRVRTLMLTILCYSLFTFLCAFSQNVWQLAILRIFCGIGIGGEQPIGAAYVAEELDENRRKMGAGLMHTGYYFGFFLASLANIFVGENFGWRGMFILGGVPALLIAFIRYGVRESKKWHEKFGHEEAVRPKMTEAFGTLFSPLYKKDTIVMSGLFLISIVLLWAGSILVPTAITQIATRVGYEGAEVGRIRTYGGGVLAVGTILGCVLAPLIAERIGRPKAMALLFSILGVSAAFGFGRVFYLPGDVLVLFIVTVFFMGLGGANFAVYTLWLPELYTTECRASAIGFISSVGRFAGVALVFGLSAGIAGYGSLGVLVAVVAGTFVIGLMLLPFSRDTTGQPLPA